MWKWNPIRGASMLNIKSVILGFFIACTLSGCSVWRYGSESIKFANDIPEPVSVAWRDKKGDIWLVPKRGIFISDIRGGASWSAQGSYIVVRGSPEQIKLHSQGRWWNLVIHQKT